MIGEVTPGGRLLTQCSQQATLSSVRLRSTVEFSDWKAGLTPRLEAQVDDRLDRIREHDHFGDSKAPGDALFELRWKSGLRVYFGYVVDESGNAVLLLLGGDKDGQSRDIGKARRILAREAP